MTQIRTLVRNDYWIIGRWFTTVDACEILHQQKMGVKTLQNTLVGGCIPTPLKNMKVNWDDAIPNISGKIPKMATIHHQPLG